jgi:hypothetical protein
LAVLLRRVAVRFMAVCCEAVSLQGVALAVLLQNDAQTVLWREVALAVLWRRTALAVLWRGVAGVVTAQSEHLFYRRASVP